MSLRDRTQMDLRSRAVSREGAKTRRSTGFLLRAVAVTLAVLAPRPVLAGTVGVAAAKEPNQPNLDISIYRRDYTPRETVPLRLSAINAPAVRILIHRLDLDPLTPTSMAMASFANTLAKLNAQHLPRVRDWLYNMGKTYKDQWNEREIEVSPLPPGTYLVRARYGKVEKRTWFAITNVALLAKRSRQRAIVYAVLADSGRPVSGMRIRAVDERGHALRATTDKDGLVSFASGPDVNILWITGVWRGHPGYVLSGMQGPPDPYAIYSFTDRPLYRPGQKVEFTGMVRQRFEADAPGGFVYRPYAQQKVTVEIRDPTDALIYRKDLSTNAFGSYSGNVQLASDTAMGNWQLVTSAGDFRSYSIFNVLAYRKPEMTASFHFDSTHYLGGMTVPAVFEARYYFGQPVAHAPVTYSFQFQGGGGEAPQEGQGVTDDQGQLKIDVPTRAGIPNRTLLANATVTDLSRRSQAASGSVLITYAPWKMALSTDHYAYHPGEQVAVELSCVDYDGKPVSAEVTTTVSEWLFDPKRVKTHRDQTSHITIVDDNGWWRRTEDHQVLVGANGKGRFSFLPWDAGSVDISGTADASKGIPVSADCSIWVVGDVDVSSTWPTLQLFPDRTSHLPGDTAAIFLRTALVNPDAPRVLKAHPKQALDHPYTEAWALVTVEGERLYSQQVIHLTRHTGEIHLPIIEKYAPSVIVHVTILQDRQVYDQQVAIQVDNPQHRLQITVQPDKGQYSPAEMATWTVTTRDYTGKPVPAEVSVGVVDASLYDIMPDTTPDMGAFFYPPQQQRVNTDFSFAGQYSGGGYQNIPSSTDTSAGIRVRKQFADTAFWNPMVLTGPDGTAKVSYTMPDNLTTWRATARGMTLDTAVGSTTQNVISSMPLLVRLELPRFYVQGDEAVLSAVVHNYTGETRTVKTKIETTGVDVEGNALQTLTLAAGDEQRVDWKARIHTATPGSGGIDGPASARFTVIADGGPGGQDAMELTLPVSPFGLKEVEASANALTEQEQSWTEDLSRLPKGATISLSLSPSIASTLLDALDYLTSYPYGCAEQTMSSFLPDVVVQGTFHHLGIQRNVNPDLDRWVSLGLQKLYHFQHADGGWQWWDFDQTDGDMTSYVLWGLIQARDAGCLVDDQRIKRGAAALTDLLQDQRDLGSRADWLYTLAFVDPAQVATPIAELYKKRDRLNLFDQASLCLALNKVGEAPGIVSGAPAMADALAADLEQSVKVRGTLAYWPADPADYTWHHDDAALTAHVLRALLVVRPQSTLILPAVRWLMANRDGQAWSSTRTSAEVVFALSKYLERTGELYPSYKASVTLDGQPLLNLSETKPVTGQPATITPGVVSGDPFAPPVMLTLTPQQLAGRHSLVVDKQGPGSLYVTRTLSYLVPPEQVKPEDRGISVHRLFRVSASDPIHADTLNSGDDMEVTVEIDSDSDYRYVVVEDPIPAGCEVSSSADEMGRCSFRSSWNEGGYARQEVHDDKIVTMFDLLPAGRTILTYRLHAETPGLYHILPSLASLVYFPEIRGNAGLASARVVDKE